VLVESSRAAATMVEEDVMVGVWMDVDVGALMVKKKVKRGRRLSA